MARSASGGAWLSQGALHWLGRLRRAWCAVRATGVLGSRPLLALAQLVGCVWREGAGLPALLAWHAQRHPHRLAVTDPLHSLTFQALNERVARLRHCLQAEFTPLRCVALWGGNQMAYVEALLACSSAGAQTVLLNTQWGAEDLRGFFQQTQVDLVLCDPEHADRLMAVLQSLALPVRPVCRQWNDICTCPPLRGLNTVGRRQRAGAVVVWSSGTSGNPHAAVAISPSAGLDILIGLLEGLQPSTGEAVLLVTPLLHGQGLATLALTLGLGATLNLLPRPDATDMRACIRRHHIRTLVVVPTLLHRLLSGWPGHDADLSSLQTIVCGSAPLDPALVRECLQRLGPCLYNLYGSTETGVIALATPRVLQQAPGCVGHLLPGTRVHFVPVDGEPGGSLHVQRGRGAWVAPGDLAWIDAADRLHLRGRHDELLVCGGQKVVPQMLEDRINVLPYIQESVVFGVPDAEYGHSIQLGVVLQAGHEHVTRAAIEADLRALLPRTLRPRQVRFLRQVPRTLTGKPRRVLAWTDLEL